MSLFVCVVLLSIFFLTLKKSLPYTKKKKVRVLDAKNFTEKNLYASCFKCE